MPTIIKLEKGEYRNWKISLIRALATRKLTSFIDGSAEYPTPPPAARSPATEDAWKAFQDKVDDYSVSDDQAMNMIESSLSKEYLKSTASCKSAYEMFDTLTSYLERKGQNAIWNAQRKLSDLKYTSSDDITTYFNELEAIVETIKEAGATI